MENIEQSVIDNFKQEFRELLEKYNVSIGFTCNTDSDDQNVEVDLGNETVIIVSGNWLGAEDV